MATKKRRRAWELEYSQNENDDDDDAFGHAAKLREEQMITDRRKRLLEGGQNPHQTSERRPVQEQPVKEEILNRPSSELPEHQDNAASAIDSPKKCQRDELSLRTDRELRAALLQLRDSAGQQHSSRHVSNSTSDHSKLRTKITVDCNAIAHSIDMFAATPVLDKVAKASLNKDDLSRTAGGKAPTGATVGVDDPADEEGYARIKMHEALDGGRYIAGPILGQGVFATVYRATVQDSGREVAVKVLRNNDVMRRAGKNEMDYLRRIVEADPQDKRHCVRMLDSFEHRGHVVIVFEALSMNLRDVIKRFGGGKGIRLAAVRHYASQMLSALRLLGHLNLIHADIKPDNALVSADKGVLKLCDFGSALHESHGEVDATPYLVSRFYRAPEVVLGYLPYGRELDIWSVACVLFELYTGRIAFPGRNNNEMLRLIQEACGSVPSRIVRRSAFRSQYFDDKGRFLSKEIDPVTNAEFVRAIRIAERPKEDVIRQAVLAASHDDDDSNFAPLLADLLLAMFTVDPTKRITPNEAIKAPFFATNMYTSSANEIFR